MKKTHWLRVWVVLLFAAGMLRLSIGAGAGAAPGEPPRQAQYSLYLPVARMPLPQAGDPVANQYVVTLRSDLMNSSAEMAGQYMSSYGGTIVYVNENTVKGFVLKLPPDNAAQALAALANDPWVSSVEPDRYISAPVDWSSDSQRPAAVASWGLDRIDQRGLPLDQNYTPGQSGAGVRVFIIDTGIRSSHSDFGGRVVNGYDAVDGSLPADDCNGHGTHVAATVGGSQYGVAKEAQLGAVRVLDCQGFGSYGGVIDGIDWVTSQKLNNPGTPMVANMSLGGGASQLVDDAVARSVAAGVVYVVAAGNDNGDACSGSPARAPAAVTVGATTASDDRAGYSNWGGCVDIFAPGSGITSAWNTGDQASAVLNGTSMASPHVAGAAALYLQSHPAATPAEVAAALAQNASTGVVDDPGSGSPNRLVYLPPAGQQPDLVVSDLKVLGLWGDAIQYQYTIKNIGTAPANLDGPTMDNEADNVSVQAFLSQDTIFNNSGDAGAGGTIVGLSPLGYLNPGESRTGSFKCTVDNPSNWNYLTLKVDWGESASESNESNNTLAVPLASVPRPDLVVVGLQVTSMNTTTIRYQYTIKNIGAAPANLDGPTMDNEADNVSVQAFLSQDTVFNNGVDSPAGGTIVGLSPLGYLDPGETWTRSFTSSADNPPAWNYLTLMVDWGQSLVESNESNNYIAVPIP